MQRGEIVSIAYGARDPSPESDADKLFRLAVEACPSGLVMTDDAGRIVLANAEVERLFGYRRADLIGQAIELLLPERLREAHLNQRDAAIRSPEPRRLGQGQLLVGRRHDGSEFPIEIGLYTTRDAGKLFVLAVMVDVSERTRLDRLKDEFVSMASHELRTPLTSIAGSLGLLVGGAAGPLSEPAARLIRIAQSNSQRLVRLINDILDIEKIESGQIAFRFKRLSVRTTAEQVIEASRAYADGFDVRVRLDPSALAGEVYADGDRLAQVITNLLSNAIKFSPPGGEVAVGIGGRDGMVRLTVRDRGPGIPIAFRARIFEKFAQADIADERHKGGAGLGLSIVKQIVARLGGTVGFEDAAGGGTIFYVDLPGWTQAAACERRAADRPQILHVDDDQDAREIVAQILDSTADVVSVDSIEAARRALSNHKFDLVILDITLDAASGFDLLPDLRSRNGAPIPVIVFSAHSSDLGGDLKGDLKVEVKLTKSSAAALRELMAAVHERLPVGSVEISAGAV